MVDKALAGSDACHQKEKKGNEVFDSFHVVPLIPCERRILFEIAPRKESSMSKSDNNNS